MANDKEAQEDEMLAMESIFDQDAFSLATVDEGELQSGKIKIHLELPERFFIAVGGDRDIVSDGEASHDVKGRSQAQYRVQFVPPISLHFTLPSEYPGKSKPHFTLVSTWLHRSSLSVLARKLDKLWEENSGSGVLFTWTNYLQSNALTDLGITYYYDVSWPLNPTNLFKRDIANSSSSDIQLDSQASTANPVHCTSNGHQTRKQFRHHLDHRAISEELPKCTDKHITLLEYLLAYNEEKVMSSFLQSSHSCEICFSIKMGTVCTRFLCGHIFCKNCVSSCFTTHITEGNMHLVKCLAVNCQMRPTPENVKALVGEELYLRYDDILLKRAIDNMTDVVYCPRPKCQNPVICDPGDKCAFCMVCGYNFCSVCKLGYHGVESCQSEEDKLEELSKKCEPNRLNEFMDNLRSVNWIREKSKPCPTCQTPIQKFQGCQMVICYQCDTTFNWCRAQKIGDYPYAQLKGQRV